MKPIVEFETLLSSKLAVIFLPSCLSWHIGESLGTLPPPVEKCNDIKPLAVMRIMSAASLYVSLEVETSCFFMIKITAGVKHVHIGGNSC